MDSATDAVIEMPEEEGRYFHQSYRFGSTKFVPYRYRNLRQDSVKKEPINKSQKTKEHDQIEQPQAGYEFVEHGNVNETVPNSDEEVEMVCRPAVPDSIHHNRDIMNLDKPQQSPMPKPQMHSSTTLVKNNIVTQPSNPQRSSLSNHRSDLDKVETLLRDWSSELCRHLRETLAKQYKQEMDQSTSAGDNAQCTDRFLSKAAPSTQPYSTNDLKPLKKHSQAKASKSDFETVLDLPSQLEFECEWVRYMSTVEEYKLTEVKDAILYCIEADQVHKVEFLLDQQNIEETEEPPEGISNQRYSPNIIAMVMAAKLNRLDIVQLLEKKKHSGIHPLSLKKCPLSDVSLCDICAQFSSSKIVLNLEQSKQLLEIYYALSSPAYLFTQIGIETGIQTDMEFVDPIIEAFKLIDEVRCMQGSCPFFKKQFADVEVKCKQFAIDMLDLCIGIEEIELLLLYCSENVQDNLPSISKINDAILCNQKEFVAHPHCQILASELWHRGIPSSSNEPMSTEKRNIIYGLVIWMIALPFAGFIYIWSICVGKWGEQLQYPTNRFAAKFISLVYFLILLIVNQAMHSNHRIVHEQLNWSEISITVFIVDFTFAFIKWIKDGGNTKFADERINLCCCHVRFGILYDAVFLSVFWVWIVMRFINMFVDLKLLPDCTLAIGILLAYLKLIPLLRGNDALASLQLSFNKMVKDIAILTCITAIIVTGFVIAITTVYNHTESVKGKYDSVAEAYTTLFWAIFGSADIFEDLQSDTNTTDVGLSVNYTSSVNTTESIDNRDLYYSGVAQKYVYTLISLYHGLTVILMVNTLIAMMANTFNKIQENFDVEWKFEQTKTVISMCKQSASLPVPFTLIGVLVDEIHAGIRRCRRRFCMPCKVAMDDIEYFGKDTYSKNEYKKLFKKLEKRYFRKKEEVMGCCNTSLYNHNNNL